MEISQNDGLSLLDIIKLIWKRKILVGIITLIVLIISLLLILFWYNPNNATYQSDFELTFSGSDQDIYPTGKKFNYRDIVSLDRLNKIKQSNSKYSKINIDKLYDENNIRISRLASNDTTKISNNYSIVIADSGINDEKVIKDFISDLLKDVTNEIIVDVNSISYTYNFSGVDNYSLYTDVLNFLIYQKDIIINAYENLILTYGESYSIDGTTLNAKLSTINNTIKNLSLNGLLSMAEQNRYVIDSQDVENYNSLITTRISSLLRIKEENDLIINSYSTLGSLIVYEDIQKRIAQNASIVLQLRNLLNSYNETNYSFTNEDILAPSLPSEEYKLSIESVYKEINDLAIDLENDIKAMGSDSLVLNFESNSIVEKSGTINIFIAIVGGLVLGVILGSVVVLIIDIPRLNKNNKIDNLVA